MHAAHDASSGQNLATGLSDCSSRPLWAVSNVSPERFDSSPCWWQLPDSVSCMRAELGNEPDSLCVRTCYGAVASWRERTNAEMYNITECALRLPAVPPDDPLPSCCSEGFTSAFIEALVGDLPVRSSAMQAYPRAPRTMCCKIL
jgi:hypothetical protein